MTDIPARIMEEARRCAGEWNLIDAIATALLAAEQRARKEALEEAERVADDLPLCELTSTSAGAADHKLTFEIGASAQRKSMVAAIRALITTEDTAA